MPPNPRTRAARTSSRRRSAPATPDGGVPGVVNDGEDVDLVTDPGVIDAVGEAPKRSPADVPVNHLVEAGIFLDTRKGVLDILKERFF